jgi:hypothetical protein
MNTETQELTVLDNFRELAVYDYDVISKAAEAIEETVMAEVCDVTTHKGREREKSLAYKVSQAKQRVVKMADASIEDARATVKGVTSEKQRLAGLFDGIRDKRKADSVEWESKEKERIDGHKFVISNMREMANSGTHAGVPILTDLIEKVGERDTSLLEEFEAEGKLVKEECLKMLNQLLDGEKKAEAQAAELKRLREAEEKRIADAEKVEAEKRQLEAEAARKEQERLDAIKAKEDAEAAAKAAEEAEKQRKIDEDKRIEEAKEQAKIDERKRIEQEQSLKDAEANRLADKAEAKRISSENAELKRQADKKHRANVKNEIMKVLTDNFTGTDQTSAAIIDAIEAGNIPHVTINF